MSRPIVWLVGGLCLVVLPCDLHEKRGEEDAHPRYSISLQYRPLSLHSSVCDNKGLFRITMGSSIKHRIVIGCGGDATAAGWIWICGGWMDGWSADELSAYSCGFSAPTPATHPASW